MVKGNHFGELTAAAGALAAVGILVLIMTLIVDVQFAGAIFPGQPGKIVYFSPLGSPPGTDADIYTINPNGGDKFRVTKDGTNNVEPSYSPSGKKIAYSGLATNTRNDQDIYTINVGGGGRILVTKNRTYDSEPSYSPSGRKIAYSGYDGHDQDIYTIDARDRARVQLTQNGTDDFSPSWGNRP